MISRISSRVSSYLRTLRGGGSAAGGLATKRCTAEAIAPFCSRCHSPPCPPTTVQPFCLGRQKPCANRWFNSEGKESFWSDEWRQANLKAARADESDKMKTVLFIQVGTGCDQHGQRDEFGATKAAMRACRQAIEFNSIPSMEALVPGGRKNMKIKLRLGVPGKTTVDLEKVRAVFPYGKMLPIEVVEGGLTFESGRVVLELGDTVDMAVVVVACVTLGY